MGNKQVHTSYALFPHFFDSIL